MIGFQVYLEAKIALDARSRNREVYDAFLGALRARASSPLRILDVGSGTGAMVRKLANEELPRDVDLTAFDRDPVSLSVAGELLEQEARARGLAFERSRDGAVVSGLGHSMLVRFAAGDILQDPFDSRRFGTEPFDAVMAHAFLDIVPLRETLDRLRGLLAPAGLLYATITYDGRTTLLPPQAEGGFEEGLLAAYDRSMDERRVGGAATGGSRAGTRLLAALPTCGFEVAGCGASDWSLYPFGGRYRGSEAVFLQAILETVHAEGGRQGLAGASLDAWLQSRLADLRAARLGLIVHQLDVLAHR